MRRKPRFRFAVTCLRSAVAPAAPFGARHRELPVWLKAAIGLCTPCNMCAIPHASRGEPRSRVLTGRDEAAALISCQMRRSHAPSVNGLVHPALETPRIGVRALVYTFDAPAVEAPHPEGSAPFEVLEVARGQGAWWPTDGAICVSAMLIGRPRAFALRHEGGVVPWRRPRRRAGPGQRIPRRASVARLPVIGTGGVRRTDEPCRIAVPPRSRQSWSGPRVPVGRASR